MLLRGSTMLLESARAISQCLDSYNACGQGLPANFCCSPDTECMVLAANTTALCCPKGHDCSAIVPTTCDTELMNATKHPNSPILTTALDSDLPSCGNATCCPFGYDCVSSGGSLRCVVGKNQAVYTSLVPQQTKGVLTTLAQSTTTPVPTSATAYVDHTSTTALSTAAHTAAANSTTTVGPGPHAAPSARSGIIAGSIVASLVLLVGLAVLFWNKRRKTLDHAARKSVVIPVPPPHQHPWQYPPPAYVISKTGTKKQSQIKPATTFCETLTSSPAYVSVPAFAELQGTTPPQHPPTEMYVPQSPVELPASPLSFSLWSRPAETRKKVRNSATAFFRPPRAAFVPLSRFAATQRSENPDDNWI